MARIRELEHALQVLMDKDREKSRQLVASQQRVGQLRREKRYLIAAMHDVVLLEEEFGSESEGRDV